MLKQEEQMSEKQSQNTTYPKAGSDQTSAQQAKKKYRKPLLEKHSDTQLWAFGTMGG